MVRLWTAYQSRFIQDEEGASMVEYALLVVFSVGSIAWCGSLSHNNYNNNVSRITKNVLDRFSSDVPIPQGPLPSPHSGGDMP